MTRPILDESQIHPAIRSKIAELNLDIISEVQNTVARNQVVVVGMAQNPFPKKARKALDAAGIAYTYLEYGNYLKEWRRRNALKMWTGWPTFPMIFINQQFIGGYTELAALIKRDELRALLA